MPVENCFSLQWGYDGVDKFAVNENMGSAAQLKELIEEDGKAEIQYFAQEERPHNIDFSVAIEKLCSMYKMKEITIEEVGTYVFDMVCNNEDTLSDVYTFTINAYETFE